MERIQEVSIMASHMGINLTSSQRDAMEELERRLKGNMDIYKAFDQTFVFYRFLKARNWDINKAEIMLKKSVEFRKRINIEGLLRSYQPPEVLQKFVANFLIGYDKEQCPVLYVPIGKCDAKGLLKATKPADFEKTITKLFSEQEYALEKTIQEKNVWLPGLVMIFDASGLTLANATYRKGIETLLRLAGIMQDNAPERLKAIFLINAQSVITIPWNILKHFLATDTLRKIHVFGEEGWKEELLKMVDAEYIPAFMGGTRTDPDGNPFCKTILNQMSTVDESYYLVKRGNPLANSPGAETLFLARSSSQEIPLQIQESGTVIEWEFETKAGDVVFGLFYKENKGGAKVVEVIPLERVNTKDYVESGMYKCDKPGEYFILFDNSYSWFRSKEMFYRILVFSPQELHDNITEKCIT